MSTLLKHEFKLGLYFPPDYWTEMKTALMVVRCESITRWFFISAINWMGFSIEKIKPKRVWLQWTLWGIVKILCFLFLFFFKFSCLWFNLDSIYGCLSSLRLFMKACSSKTSNCRTIMGLSCKWKVNVLIFLRSRHLWRH